MALDTVQDYVAEARILLQDLVPTYRYADTELVSALNMGIRTAKLLRPDLFIGLTSLPSFTVSDATAFVMDDQYRPAFVYFIVGHAQLRDEEDTQDNRAQAFIGKFTQALRGVAQ
jgi:hypothetical protein